MKGRKLPRLPAFGRPARGVGPRWRSPAVPNAGATRRRFWRGMFQGSAIFVGLPLFECMLDSRGKALACGGAIPRRFGMFFWGNGNRPDRWVPAADGVDWELTDELAPLAAVKSRICVVSGLAVKVPNTVPHTSGAAGLLSGYATVSSNGDDTFAAPTVDQLIAAEIGSDTLYPSIQTAATDSSGESWNGPNSRNPPETDPYTLYQKLFGDTFREPGDEGVVDPTLGLRRSVLDSVMEDIGTLQGQLGSADRARLDQHLTGVRELEQRLAKLEEDPPSLESCARPSTIPETSYPDQDGRPQISARSRAMCDMLTMALACDQTRVFGHYLTDPVSNHLFPDATAGHHNLTHDEGGDQPEVHAITVQIVEELAYLIAALDAVPEADGTLLDNCAILGCSEVSLGQTHQIDEMPIIVAGSACGSLQTGTHIRSYTAESASKLMLSLIRSMDILATSFGDGDGYTEDGLSEIEA
jgi:hypothetical protein